VNDYGQAASDSAELEAFGLRPAAPNALTLGPYDFETSRLQMSWDDVEGETSYRVEFSYDGVNWNHSQTLGADVTERVATLGYKTRPYYFRVCAVNEYGASDWTTAKYSPAPTQPGALKFNSYDPATGKLEMSWGDSLNETRYRVEYSFDGVKWNHSQTLGANVTERVATLSYKTRPYFFRVRAENSVGVSEWTSAQFVPEVSAPNALTFGEYDHRTGQLQMSWDDVEGETSYRVEFSYDGVNWSHSQTLGANVTERVATLGYTDRDYFFRVRAENLAGVSEWTTAKFTPPVLTVPEAPTSIVFDSYDPTTRALEMSWTGVTKQATTLRVEFTYDGGATWSHSQTLSGVATGRTAKIGYTTKTYQFRVCAINALGQSEWTYSELFNANEWTASNANAVSETFAELFADGSEEAFWLELEETLANRRK
ncbi:MAG: hypothetical protein IJE97_09915, partial [Thermoguttaceae bacterium]|nr:hypothetical protein [Thermoguttaceae bacterium]